MPEGTESNVIPFVMNRASLEIVEKRAHIEGSAIVALAREILVSDPASYVAASELRKEVNAKDKILGEQFEPIKKGIMDAHWLTCDFERKARGPYQEARTIINGKLVTWDDEQERIRKKEEARLREAAQKLEDDRRLREAEAAVAAGLPQESALAALETPSTMPMPSLPSSVPKVAGQSFRINWEAEVFDFPALLMFAAMHPEMAASLVVANQVGLNSLARSQKEALNVPGVRPVGKKIVSGSRG